MIDRLAGTILLGLSGLLMRWSRAMARLSAAQWRWLLRINVSETPFLATFLGLAAGCSLAGALLWAHKISAMPLIRLLFHRA